MKTTTNSKNRSGRPFPHIMNGLLVLLAAGTLASCSTSTHSVATVRSTPTAASTGAWKMVQANPPTYFPKGVAADHPTGCWDGKWVATGDREGTRYFIPARAANSEALLADALAAMDPAKRRRIDQEIREDFVKRAVGTTLITPPLAILAVSGAYSGESLADLIE